MEGGGCRQAAVAGGWFDPGCSRCQRLASFLRSVAADHPAYHCAPVAPFGDPAGRLLVVGLAPGMHGANRTGRPFTGDHAGILLYKTLHHHRFATAPQSLAADDGLALTDCRLTNAVKCLPPQNRPTTAEVDRCNDYLAREIAALPRPSVVIALGTVAHRAVLRSLGAQLSRYPFAHAAEHRPAGQLVLIDSYHCSRYNTQTRRLTAEMFDTIFLRARQLLDRGDDGG